MSGAHVHITYFPTETDRPYGTIGDNNVALHVTRSASYQSLTLQFSYPADDASAIRYLRALAAAATDLADDLEQRKLDRERALTEAVLSS